MNRKIAQSLGLAVVALLALSSASWAAEGAGAIHGVVMDGSRNPVANMTVRATDVVDPSKMFTAVSDRNGKFSIAQTPAGSYLVSADTVNTSWIQKDESPIVEVSGAGAPSVTLVLVKSGELMPAMGGGNGGSQTLELAALGMASVATAGTIVSIIQHDEQEEDHDALELDHDKLFLELDQLQKKLDGLLKQTKDGDAKTQAEIQKLLDEIKFVQKQIKDLQKQVKDLEKKLVSPFK